MAEDYAIVLPTKKTVENAGKDTLDTTLELIENSYEELRAPTEDRAARSDDYGLDTGGNSFSYDTGSDDIWGL